MMNLKKTVFIELTTALFIFLFAYTAIHKLLHFKQFIFFLNKFELFNNIQPIIAWSVVVSELIITSMLLSKSFREKGLLASFGLMSFFTLFIIYMMLTSNKLPCSCGGIINRLSWNQHLILNILLIGLAAFGFYIHRKQITNKDQLPT